MTAHAQAKLTAEEYLRLDRAAERKSELFHGEMFAMAGASPRHGLIVGNLATALNVALGERDCRVLVSDVRLEVAAGEAYAYPDLMVVCGPLDHAGDRRDMVRNPILVAEVLSPSTQDYDRGGKFVHYRGLASLRDDLLVAQDAPHLELFSRQPDGRWLLAEADGADGLLELPALGVRLRLADVYRRVEMATPTGSDRAGTLHGGYESPSTGFITSRAKRVSRALV